MYIKKNNTHVYNTDIYKLVTFIFHVDCSLIIYHIQLRDTCYECFVNNTKRMFFQFHY